MNALDLLADLRSLGVRLVPDGDQLRWRAPRGVLTSELLGQLRDRKADGLAELRRGQPALAVSLEDVFENRTGLTDHDVPVLDPDSI